MLRYHNITSDDMRNGDGLRTVLWLAGCEHHCPGCQNPITWDPNGGIEFDEAAKEELFEKLSKDYISGITFSGGDPLHPNNVSGVYDLICTIMTKYPGKTIWLYTGYTWEELWNPRLYKNEIFQKRMKIVNLIDVLVDGRFVKELADVNYPWAGSKNQRVIDVQKSIIHGCVVRYESR